MKTTYSCNWGIHNTSDTISFPDNSPLGTKELHIVGHEDLNMYKSIIHLKVYCVDRSSHPLEAKKSWS